ncbi:MAG: hypothetical protein HC822_01100 [Oscillochloris sp.]|nr:hypothetical protein [Oscillochloris sp.]
MSQPEDPKGPNPQQTDLGQELRELGQQIEQALRTALESDRARQVRDDIAAGMREISTQMQSAVKSLQEDPRFQDLAERGTHAVDRARESKAAQDFREALTRGITQLNDQLSAFIQRSSADTPPSSAPSGDIPPATGETTRLDPDEK